MRNIQPLLPTLPPATVVSTIAFALHIRLRSHEDDAPPSNRRFNDRLSALMQRYLFLSGNLKGLVLITVHQPPLPHWGFGKASASASQSPESGKRRCDRPYCNILKSQAYLVRFRECTLKTWFETLRAPRTSPFLRHPKDKYKGNLPGFDTRAPIRESISDSMHN